MDIGFGGGCGVTWVVNAAGLLLSFLVRGIESGEGGGMFDDLLIDVIHIVLASILREGNIGVRNRW